MSPANINDTVALTWRTAIALLILCSYTVSFAQLPADTPEARLAAATREVASALELARQNTPTSIELAVTKLYGAEKVFAELGEKKRQIATLFFLGHCQLVLNKPDAGVESLTKALPIAREIDDTEQQIRILGRLGEHFFRDGKGSMQDREKARDYLQQAADVIEKAVPKPPRISYATYELLGRVWMSFYHAPNADKYFSKAYELVKDSPPAESIPALIRDAEYRIEMGYPKAAVRRLNEAGRRASEAKLYELEAKAAVRLGDLLTDIFLDLPLAKNYLSIAERILKDHPQEAMLPKLQLAWGKYYFATFDLQKAEELYDKARAGAQKAGQTDTFGEALLRLGVLSYALGDYQKAIPLLTNAAETNALAEKKLLEMHSLRYLAKTQSALGMQKEADATMGRASYARGASGQGWTSAESVAIQIDRANFVLHYLLKNPKGEFSASALSRARNYLELAYSVAKRENMREHISVAAERLALVYSLGGDKLKAITMLNESLISARSAGLLSAEAGALKGLMDLSLSMGSNGSATFYGKSAVNVYQQLRKKITDLRPEERTAYLRTIEGTYRKLASLLIEQGRIAEAEQVLTLLKEEELIEYVRRDDDVARNMLETLALTNDERAAMQRYEVIADRITALGKEFSELERERRSFTGVEFPQQKRYDELKKQLEDATLVFERFLEELKLKFGQSDSKVVQVDSSLKRTLERLKADTTAVVTTIVGEDTLNIIVTTSRTQRAHAIKKSGKEINELVAKLRQALTSPQYDPRPASQLLYDLLVKPIEGDLAGIKADTIVWSLDGTLRYVPPAALWDKQKGYLVERFSNVIVNLASRDTIGLPVPKGTDLSVLGVGVSKPVDGFASLPAVPDELDCIVADKSVGFLSTKPQCKAGVLNGRKLLDERFTLANFQGELGRYPIVHIASHFKLTPGDDKNSFLLLGGGDDRRFTVDKLRNESLVDVELIVLSACNTATPGGAKANGIEIEGFGSIAQREGAKAVMATLWPVADSSTKDFMVAFYNSYGVEGKSKADSVRLAQLKLLRGMNFAGGSQQQRADEFVPTASGLPPFTADPKAPFAHPYFWSPFILIGNWR